MSYFSKLSVTRFFCFILLSTLSLSQAQSIEFVSSMLNSIENNHPKILAKYNKYLESIEKINEKKGNLDLKLSLDGNIAAQGFYDGSYINGKIQQDFAWSGLSAFSEYRYSNGNFPSYEAQFETLSMGELSMGIQWSLLRALVLDPLQIEIIKAQAQRDIQNQSLKLSVLDLQEKALKNYFKNVSLHLISKVYLNLYKLAQSRQNALEKKHALGDIALIYLKENQRYLLERKRLQDSTKRDFNVAKQAFEIFIEHNQISQLNSNLIKSKPLYTKLSEINLSSQKFFENYPHLKILTLQKELISKQFKTFKNSLLPDLKLKAKLSRDRGNGNVNLRGQEFDIGALLSYPLHNRKAKAQFKQIKLQYENLNIQCLTQKYL